MATTTHMFYEPNKHTNDLRSLQSKQIDDRKLPTDSITSDLRSDFEANMEKRFANLEMIIKQNFTSGSVQNRFQESISSTTLPPPRKPPDPPDFPMFSGIMVREWIKHCEKFFYLHSIPPEKKTRLASLHMQGKALQWHKEFIRNNYEIFPSWTDYVILMLSKSRELNDEHVSELENLKQAGDSTAETIFHFANDESEERKFMETTHMKEVADQMARGPQVLGYETPSQAQVYPLNRFESVVMEAGSEDKSLATVSEVMTFEIVKVQRSQTQERNYKFLGVRTKARKQREDWNRRSGKKDAALATCLTNYGMHFPLLPSDKNNIRFKFLSYRAYVETLTQVKGELGNFEYGVRLHDSIITVNHDNGMMVKLDQNNITKAAQELGQAEASFTGSICATNPILETDAKLENELAKRVWEPGATSEMRLMRQLHTQALKHASRVWERGRLHVEKVYVDCLWKTNKLRKAVSIADRGLSFLVCGRDQNRSFEIGLEHNSLVTFQSREIQKLARVENLHWTGHNKKISTLKSFGRKVCKPPDRNKKLIANETMVHFVKVKEHMTDVRFKLVSSKEALVFSTEQMKARESTVIAYTLLGVLLKGESRALSSLVKNYGDGTGRNELQCPCLLQTEVKRDAHMFLLGNVVKRKRIGTYEAEFCYKSDSGFDFGLHLLTKQSCDYYDIGYFMKHKWKSKQSRADSMFKSNHHFSFAKLVLKQSGTDSRFDGNGFSNYTHGELSFEVMSLLILLLKHIMRSKCKGDSLMKATHDVLAAHNFLWVKNELQGTKLWLGSSTEQDEIVGNAVNKRLIDIE